MPLVIPPLTFYTIQQQLMHSDVNDQPAPLHFCYVHSHTFFSHPPIASIMHHSWLQEFALLIELGYVGTSISQRKKET